MAPSPEFISAIDTYNKSVEKAMKKAKARKDAVPIFRLFANSAKMKDTSSKDRPAKKLIDSIKNCSNDSEKTFRESFEKVCKIIIPDASTTWEALKLDENKMEGIYDNFLNEIGSFCGMINSSFSKNKICKSLYDNLIECRNLVVQFEKQGLKNKVYLRNLIQQILKFPKEDATNNVKYLLGEESTDPKLFLKIQSNLKNILGMAKYQNLIDKHVTSIEHSITDLIGSKETYTGDTEQNKTSLKINLEKSKVKAKSILHKLKSKIPGKYYILKKKYIAIDKKIDELFDAAIKACE